MEQIQEQSVNKSIFRRIKKLFEHAEHANANPNEAANALATANALMARYRLDRAIVEAETGVSDKDENINEEAIYTLRTKTIQNWIAYLANNILQANHCKFYWSRAADGHPAVMAVGRVSDRLACKMLLEYVVHEIDRLAELALKQQERYVHGKTFGNNFRLGAVETIAQRLKEANANDDLSKPKVEEQAAQKSNEVVSQALMIIERNQQAVDCYYKDLSAKLNLRSRAVSHIRLSATARNAGREAGKNIHLGANLNARSRHELE